MLGPASPPAPLEDYICPHRACAFQQCVVQVFPRGSIGAQEDCGIPNLVKRAACLGSHILKPYIRYSRKFLNEFPFILELSSVLFRNDARERQNVAMFQLKASGTDGNESR